MSKKFSLISITHYKKRWHKLSFENIYGRATSTIMQSDIARQSKICYFEINIRKNLI